MAECVRWIALWRSFCRENRQKSLHENSKKPKCCESVKNDDEGELVDGRDSVINDKMHESANEILKKMQRISLMSVS